MVPLSAAAVIEDPVAAVFVADRGEAPGDLTDRSVPVNFFVRSIVAPPEPRARRIFSYVASHVYKKVFSEGENTEARRAGLRAGVGEPSRGAAIAAPAGGRALCAPALRPAGASPFIYLLLVDSASARLRPLAHTTL